ncbi:hypothetical protein [Streptomyces sp. NPDC059256]|uniref:hypothetical protein n=1 Tax=Streptomyces sp. NPDC059256 TaxID=3346794 RepID=UPI0036A5BC6F
MAITCSLVRGVNDRCSVAGGVPLIASGAFVWLGFFGFGWYGPWVAYVTEAAPPGKTGFALGLAMSVNQIAIVTMPPALGLLADLTGSFTPVWALLGLLIVVALTVTAAAEHRTRRPPRTGDIARRPHPRTCPWSRCHHK